MSRGIERDEDWHAVNNAISFMHFQSVAGLMVKTGVPKPKIKKILKDMADDLVYDDQGRVAYENGEYDDAG